MDTRDVFPREAASALSTIASVPPSCLSATPPLALAASPSSTPLHAPSSAPRPLSCSPSSLVSFHSPAGAAAVLGCSHYERKCLVHAPCCPPDVFHCCRFCHDEAVSEHKIDRHAISEMVCMLCAQQGVAKAQPVAQHCIECGQCMARYYCSVCRFFDDAAERAIFHCVKCGICRRGKVSEFFHCDTCNCCYSEQLRGEHKCIENVLSGDCPVSRNTEHCELKVCLENMFSSTLPVRFLQNCGHAIHESCLDALVMSPDLTTPARCPACKKSIRDNPARDLLIDSYLQTYRMPEQYSAWRAVVQCNDCLRTNEMLYHFVFHRCPNAVCLSYNTDVLSVKKLEAGCAEDVRWRQQEEQKQREQAEARGEGAEELAAADAARRRRQQQHLRERLPPELADSLHDLMQINGLQYTGNDAQRSPPEAVLEAAAAGDNDGEDEDDEDYAERAEDDDDDGDDEQDEDEEEEEEEDEEEEEEEEEGEGSSSSSSDEEVEDEDAEDEDGGWQLVLEGGDDGHDDARMPDIHDDDDEQ